MTWRVWATSGLLLAASCTSDAAAPTTSLTTEAATTTTSTPIAVTIAASVDVSGGAIEVKRDEVDELTALLMDEPVARTILFLNEEEDHVRRQVTRWLVLRIAADAFVPGEIDPTDLDDIRRSQVRQLYSEMVSYDYLDPEARAEEMAADLRPYLDVVATVSLKRRTVDDFAQHVAELSVSVDPAIGTWDAERQTIRAPDTA